MEIIILLCIYAMCVICERMGVDPEEF